MPSPGLWPAPTTMATRSFKRMSVHSRNLQYGSSYFLGMHDAPDDGAERTQPQNDRSGGLDSKATPALFGGPRIAGQVKEAAGDPDQAQHGRGGIADIDREQP